MKEYALFFRRLSEGLSDDTLVALLEASEEDLELAQETTANAIHEVMSNEIHIDEVEEARNQAERRVLISTIDPGLYRSMIEIARLGVTANYLLDEEATEEAREAAVEAVEPVMIREELTDCRRRTDGYFGNL